MSSSVLFDFSAPAPDAPTAWRSIDDPVMGGVSNSQFVKTEEGAAFTGTLSLNQGGGKWYRLTMYTEAGGPISYRASLHPPTNWTTVTLPFDPAQLRTIGFLIADEQEGPFRLEVLWIRATGP